ncbi:hypothetical protein DFJ63DRAFT_57319 [Scheffersomyces coipomensis]|uniref:uncharacterized protein n=1 Tax=Scheffersomyces coipomensis TaxID=1788519 RepID=UPI00315D2CA0
MFKANIRLNGIGRQSIRSNSTTAPTYIRRRPKFRDLMKAPVVKSIFLSLIFGTVMVDYMKTKKELELLTNTHKTKFSILENIIEKLKNGEHIDVGRELRIADKLTRNKYDRVTDIELDDQLDKFLKMAESTEPVEFEVAEKEEVVVVKEVADNAKPSTQPTKIDSSKFL